MNEIKFNWQRSKMDSLNERRAEFVQEAARLEAIAAKAPVIPAHWFEREEAFRKQFLPAIEKQCSDRRSMSPEALHAAWRQSYQDMGWRFGEDYSQANKTHPDMVPYDQLGQREKDKDGVFILLCEIARRFIRE